MENKKALSVNYHILSNCNMNCEFCFAKFPESKKFLGKNYYNLDEAKSLIRKLNKYGFEKITFVGGEPLLYPWLSELLSLSKDLGMTTMIVTNGSLLNEKWLISNESFLDWVSLSIDSLYSETLLNIGRVSNNQPVVNYHDLCCLVKKFKVKLKINTVVSMENWQENFNDFIFSISPDRWKIFKVLRIEGQNSNMINIEINDDQFNFFKNNHQAVIDSDVNAVFETNDLMIGSYLMIDPAGRFFDNVNGFYKYSEEILKAGVEKAISQIDFDQEVFQKRGGLYKW